MQLIYKQSRDTRQLYNSESLVCHPVLPANFLDAPKAVHVEGVQSCLIVSYYVYMMTLWSQLHTRVCSRYVRYMLILVFVLIPYTLALSFPNIVVAALSILKLISSSTRNTEPLILIVKGFD